MASGLFTEPRVVPYLSPRALDRLREEKVSGIDLSGNCLVVVPGEWFIRSTGAKNRYPAGAAIKNVYREASSLVARVFFARSAFPSVQAILNEIRSRGGKVTLPTVSKALKGLEEDLLVGRGETIRVLQPDRLLDLLLENYRAPVVRRRPRIKVTDREGTLRQFAWNARKSDVYVAGDLPSRYVVLPTTDDVTRLYASSLGAVTEGIEFEEDSRFPNVEPVEIEDQTVYFDLDEEDGFPWISALQTYLILALRFVGIDLSANPRDCGVCVIEGRTISHVRHGPSASSHPDWLLRHCSGASAVGMDAPFGWPKLFIDTLRGYEIGVAFDHDRRRYRLRTTDLWIKDTLRQHLRRNTAPPSPFSVSTGKLGVTAMVGTILLQGLSEKFEVSPRHSVSDRAVLKVYPSASLWAWGLPHRGVDVGAALQTLEDAFDLDVGEDERRQLLGSRHCFDALVAALTAREYTSDNTYDPPEDVPEEVLRVEGWIRVPSRSLTGAPG